MSNDVDMASLSYGKDFKLDSPTRTLAHLPQSSDHALTFESESHSQKTVIRVVESNDADVHVHNGARASSCPAIKKVDSDIQTESPPARAQRRKRLIQFLTLCWVFILEGWNDSSLGPLLPAIQEYYKIDYTTVSLIFFFLCIGDTLGAIANVYIVHRFDFGKTILLGTIGQIVAYSIIIPGPRFSAVVFAYTLYGFATMMQTTQVNSFVAGLNDPSKMGILHCVYGTGAFLSPFVSTVFATKRLWHLYFFTAFSLAVSVAASLLVVFKLKTRTELYSSAGVPVHIHPVSNSGRNIYRQLCGIRVVYLFSLFAFAYIGLETTLGGWTVTYLVRRTGAGSSAGYVSSGFFAGLALGRVLLLGVNRKIGPRRVIFLYALLTIVLEAIIWAVPHFIANAVLVSFVGLFLGPMFPILMGQCGHFFPPHLLSGGIGCVAGVGTLGGALLPFVTGILADHFGVTSMQPLMLAMMVFLIVMWAGVVYNNRDSRGIQATTSSA